MAAALFDFNGTLSDDEGVLYEVFRDLFADHLGVTLTTEDYFGRLAGFSDREIIERVAGADPDRVARLLDERARRYGERVAGDPPLRPEAAVLVRRLVAGGIPVGVVTGAARREVEPVLTETGLWDRFSAVVTEEDVARGKPDPEGYRTAAALLGVRPEDCVAFEDSLAGIDSAKGAGMTCVAVTGTHDPALLRARADLVVDALGPDVFDTLATWRNRG